MSEILYKKKLDLSFFLVEYVQFFNGNVEMIIF